jgi:glycosyltransferase involved in cell wall biosynthesis
MFLPVSRAVADGNDLAKSGLPYQVIPNFVPDHIASAPADDPHAANLPGNDYLLFVGDVSQDKGAHVLIQAYANLASAIPLVLIGRQNMALPTSLANNVHILPSMPHDAVMRAWSRSLMALAPSIWPDPCPTVVMEAMASGRPVIASRIGGLPDLVADGETGLLVPPGNPVALSQAMHSLITRSDLRVRMGQAAKRAVVQFQAGAVVPRIERLYAQLIESKRAL